MGFSALGLRVARLGLLRVGVLSRWADELCALCGAGRADPLGESGGLIRWVISALTLWDLTSDALGSPR